MKPPLRVMDVRRIRPVKAVIGAATSAAKRATISLGGGQYAAGGRVFNSKDEAEAHAKRRGEEN